MRVSLCVSVGCCGADCSLATSASLHFIHSSVSWELRCASAAVKPHSLWVSVAEDFLSLQGFSLFLAKAGRKRERKKREEQRKSKGRGRQEEETATAGRQWPSWCGGKAEEEQRARDPSGVCQHFKAWESESVRKSLLWAEFVFRGCTCYSSVEKKCQNMLIRKYQRERALHWNIHVKKTVQRMWVVRDIPLCHVVHPHISQIWRWW